MLLLTVPSQSLIPIFLFFISKRWIQYKFSYFVRNENIIFPTNFNQNSRLSPIPRFSRFITPSPEYGGLNCLVQMARRPCHITLASRVFD